MTKNIGSPFYWGFNEQRAIETLAKRGKAKYNKPREIIEQKTALENFFEQNVSTSTNPAHVVEFTAVSPEPYIISSSSKTNNGCEVETEHLDDTVTENENPQKTN